MIDNLYKFYLSREKVINFLRDFIEVLSDANYDAKQNETRGTELKVLAPKQMLQRLLTAVAQVNTNIKMEAIFMNPENSKMPKLHALILKLANKLDLRLGEKIIVLSNISIYYTWENMKSSNNNNKFKISAPTWYDKFELPDGSYSVSDIQDYIE